MPAQHAVSLPLAPLDSAGTSLPDSPAVAPPPPPVQAPLSADDVSARPRATETSSPPPAPHTTGGDESLSESALAPPAKRLFLDLFAGASSPVSHAIAELGLARLEPVDVLVGPAHNLLDDLTFQNLQRLCSSGLIGVAAAAPPCAAFSRARLRQGGPPPVRTVSHPTGIPQPSASQAKELETSALLHSRTRHLLHLVACRGGMIWLENPSSSLLWLDPEVIAWCRLTAPFMATVAACQVGMPLHKSWSFCCNDASVSRIASLCPHPVGFHTAVSGKRAADGSFLTRKTAAYPAPLATSLAQLAVPWLSSDTTCGVPVPLDAWTSLLPSRLPWPVLKHRVEDGAGTCSTARPDPAKFSDPLRSLRTSWSRRFLSGGVAVRIAAALNSGSRDPPLSDSELEPFLSDLRSFLGVSDDATWSRTRAEVRGTTVYASDSLPLGDIEGISTSSAS